jgi:hypothetical protein
VGVWVERESCLLIYSFTVSSNSRANFTCDNFEIVHTTPNAVATTILLKTVN